MTKWSAPITLLILAACSGGQIGADPAILAAQETCTSKQMTITDDDHVIFEFSNPGTYGYRRCGQAARDALEDLGFSSGDLSRYDGTTAQHGTESATAGNWTAEWSFNGTTSRIALRRD